jgi:hypothetical protein
MHGRLIVVIQLNVLIALSNELCLCCGQCGSLLFAFPFPLTLTFQLLLVNLALHGAAMPMNHTKLTMCTCMHAHTHGSSAIPNEEPSTVTNKVNTARPVL